MSYYCGECATWQSSTDVNRYGEKWCFYSRRYEKADQNIYGCRGFVYVGRAILTRVCEILDLPTEEYFQSFDRVKERYLAPCCMEQLAAYCAEGPALAAKLGEMPDKAEVAQELLERFIQPAKALADAGQDGPSSHVYKNMVCTLKELVEKKEEHKCL